MHTEHEVHLAGLCWPPNRVGCVGTNRVLVMPKVTVVCVQSYPGQAYAFRCHAHDWSIAFLVCGGGWGGLVVTV